MIETLENGAQLVAVTVCMILSLRCLARERGRVFELLALYYCCDMLGDLYWQLHLFFYRQTPQVQYVSDVSWLASWLFLYCVLCHVSTPEERRFRHPLMLLPPLFAAGMCAFYLKWGAILSNLTTAVMMSLIMVHAVRGLLYLCGSREPRRTLYIAALFYCACEYAAWTASCFFWCDSLTSPYFWCDAALTVSIVLTLPAVRKAVDA